MILARFLKNKNKRSLSNKLGRLILTANNWRRIRRLLKEVVIDFYDKKVRKLNNILMALFTENILFKL
jgi:hypothetical protein